MDNIKHILKNKSSDVWTIGPDETVYRALEVLAEKEIGALVVVEGERVVGIFSERDYARKVILQKRSSSSTKVKELMIKNVIYASPDDSIQDSMAVMTNSRIRHLPVIEDGKLCGMVTSGDIINHIISRQKFEIDALRKYITGGY